MEGRRAAGGDDVRLVAETVTSGTWVYRVQAYRTGGAVSAYSNQVTARAR